MILGKVLYVTTIVDLRVVLVRRHTLDDSRPVNRLLLVAKSHCAQPVGHQTVFPICQARAVVVTTRLPGVVHHSPYELGPVAVLVSLAMMRQGIVYFVYVL